MALTIKELMETPIASINITNTNQVDVTEYATAQVVDNNLKAENIKKDVVVLGITGTAESFKPEETFTATPKITSQTITPTSGSVFSSGTVNPIYEEVNSSATMDSNLTDDNNRGKMYKYTGTTDTKYTNGRLYVCEEMPNYLCFTANTAGSTVKCPKAFEYSNDRQNWNTASTSSAITLTNVGDKIYLRNGNIGTPTSKLGTFVMTGSVAASGNVMSLVDNTCESLTIPCNGCYENMFKSCTSLTTPPALPATTLAKSCYESMFSDCTSLTTPPALPATTLAYNCYRDMFYGCTSLTTPPALPATTLANNCYRGMFSGCTSLTTPPALPATTLTHYCYCVMFYGCTSLTTAPELPATTLAVSCYEKMFWGCTSLTTAPSVLPAITLLTRCYDTMFEYCTSLTTAPELHATTLVDEKCCYGMFEKCTSLTTAPSVLPATTLVSNCYQNMFNGCTSLTTAPSLPATTLESGCYDSMFDGCISLTTAPELPATTLADTCYESMFRGCTSLYVSDTSVSGTCDKAWTIPTSGTFTNTYEQWSIFEDCLGTRSSDDMAGEQGQSYTYYTQNTPV